MERENEAGSPGDAEAGSDGGERRLLRELVETAGFHLLRLPGELEREFRAHRRALARRQIQRFWPLVLAAFAAAIPMAFFTGVVQREALFPVALGLAGLAVPIALVVLGNVHPRLERHAPLLDVTAAFLGLASTHAVTAITEDLPVHRHIAEHAVILVTLATCSIANQSVRSAMAVCASGVAFIVAFAFVTGLSPDWTLFPFYALGSLLVGSIVGVTSEIRERTVFVQERLLALEKHELDQMSRALAALSREDALTGLPNRRYMDEVLAREWASCMRDRAPLGLLFVDVDHFKRFNDRNGHAAGDACLRRIADALRSEAFRSTDFVARYGGEEFVGILPRTNLEGVEAVANRFLEAVDRLTIAHGASDVAPHVTISIGVASAVPDEHGSPEDLLARADTALYRAKALGRHRVVTDGEAREARVDGEAADAPWLEHA